MLKSIIINENLLHPAFALAVSFDTSVRGCELKSINMKEVFKNIPGYEGYYQVSNLGRVKSLARKVKWNNTIRNQDERILNPPITDGYRRMGLCNGIRKHFKVSILVAMAFLNHKPDGTQKIVVDHINNIRTDDRLKNLQLISQRENSSKGRKGTSKYIGVSWSKIRNKWIAAIYINGKHKNLGGFTSELEASQVYQNELLTLKQRT